MTDDEVLEMKPHIDLLMEQVQARDLDAVDAVLAGISAWFQVDGARAAAVVLAELYAKAEARVKVLEGELATVTTAYDRVNRTYLAMRGRLDEHRTILHQKSAASTAKQEHRKAA